MRVLLVDDEAELIQTLAERLTLRGIAATAVISGAQAQETLVKHTFDVAVLDVRMPGMDGLELMAWIKEHRPHLPVILLSGRGTPEEKQRGLDGGAFKYLLKPIGIDELLDTLQEAVTAGSKEEAMEDTKILDARAEEMRLIGQITASAAHEINNVFSIINERAGLLADLNAAAGADGKIDSQKIAEIAERLQKQIERGKEISQRLYRLGFSVDQGEHLFDLALILHDALGMVRRFANARGLELKVQESECSTHVSGRRIDVQLALVAGLELALKACKNDCCVKIYCQKQGQEAEICFECCHGSEESDWENELNALTCLMEKNRGEFKCESQGVNRRIFRLIFPGSSGGE